MLKNSSHDRRDRPGCLESVDQPTAARPSGVDEQTTQSLTPLDGSWVSAKRELDGACVIPVEILQCGCERIGHELHWQSAEVRTVAL